MDFYYAQTDSNGVLCVDQVAEGGSCWTQEEIAHLAVRYPSVIYFGVDNRLPEFRVPV